MAALKYLCVALAIAVVSVIAQESVPEVQADSATTKCALLILGGSTASLAAAITAAELNPSAKVCLTDPTDWVGGQLTASAVSAIDFGQLNKKAENMPASLRRLTFEYLKPGQGRCWVSDRCYLPNEMQTEYIDPLLKQFKNLEVFDRTVVKRTFVANGVVQGVELLQRAPRSATQEWAFGLSQTLNDWYSPEPSKLFTKRLFNLTATVYIEASEFGDVLATGRLSYRQGVEKPLETSPTEDTCGQSNTFTFFMDAVAPGGKPYLPNLPQGADNGLPFTLGGTPVEKVWSYRRAVNGAARVVPLPPYHTINAGDASQMNWNGGNDYAGAYMFTSNAQTLNQVNSNRWAGGVNITVIRDMENRAYGFYHWYRAAASNDTGRLGMRQGATGTATFLAKMPYLRDSRRSVGIDGFVMTSTWIKAAKPGDQTAPRPDDAVALAEYPCDIHSIHVCSMPRYAFNHDTVPFYIPFRALTNVDASNLLVAGKSMATSFYVNSATRVHPSEWTSGVAAGAAAHLMIKNNWASRDVYENIKDLQYLLHAAPISQPLVWTLPTHAPAPHGHPPKASPPPASKPTPPPASKPAPPPARPSAGPVKDRMTGKL